MCDGCRETLAVRTPASKHCCPCCRQTYVVFRPIIDVFHDDGVLQRRWLLEGLYPLNASSHTVMICINIII
jgi:hypothetical protein